MPPKIIKTSFCVRPWGNYTMRELIPNLKKTEVVLFYNTTKSGTDTFDQLCSTYSVSRKKNRWSFKILLGMLDHAGINAMVLYYLHFTKRVRDAKDDGTSLIRRLCLQNLGLSLLKPLLTEWIEKTTLRVYLRETIKEILNLDEPSQPSSQSHTPRQKPWSSSAGSFQGGTRCVICKREGQLSTKVSNCELCQHAICYENTITCFLFIF